MIGTRTAESALLTCSGADVSSADRPLAVPAGVFGSPTKEFSSSLKAPIPTVPRVQDERRWELRPVCRLIALICISVLMGSLVLQAFGNQLSQKLHASEEFVAHLLAFLTLHGCALFWIWVFLSEHDLSWTEGFGFNKAPLRSIGLGLAVTALAVPIAMLVIGGGVTALLKAVGLNPEAQRTVMLIKDNNSVPQLVVLGFAAAVLAPIAEESIFRGVLFRALYQRGYRALAWAGTSLLFAVIHGNLAAFFPLVFLAFVFAWLYHRTGNLLASMAGHFLFNTLNFWLLVAPPKWMEGFLNQ